MLGVISHRPACGLAGTYFTYAWWLKEAHLERAADFSLFSFYEETPVMLGDTLTITLPVGGAKVLNKINQDGYSSEYFLKEALTEYRVRVRHTTAKAGGGLEARSRHNVEFTERIYATATVDEIVRKCYVVFENYEHDTDEDNVDGLCAYLVSGTILADLFGWQS